MYSHLSICMCIYIYIYIHLCVCAQIIVCFLFYSNFLNDIFYIFSLSLCTYIIIDLYYQTWAVSALGRSSQHTEKPTGCTQWPLSVCMWAAEGMPTPLWKWTLCREHASHYHLGVTTSVSSVFMRPGWKSNSCFLLLNPKCCSSLSRVFSPRVSAIISPKEIITVLMCGSLTARVTDYRPKVPQTRDMHVVL